MNAIKLIVTCTFGLEAVVKRELNDLGFHDLVVADGKIEFDAALADIARLNVNLRAADRVLFKVAEFPATDFGQLFDRTKALSWESWIIPEAMITVTGKSVRSILASVRSAQSLVKKAILDHLSAALSVEVFPESGPEFSIQVAILKDVVQLTLDTTGPGLHRRGYRQHAGEAPLRENIAAALVMLTFWEKDRLLVDPMCGAGTILIEAAMIARRMAPGRKRSFAAEAWPFVPADLWGTARSAAEAAVLPAGGLKIQGYDIDPGAVKDAKVNAEAAGVGGDIVFEQKDIKDLWIDKQFGIVISNPPYGDRLASLKELTPLYVNIHKMFKSKTGWSLYILTGDVRFPDFFKRGKPDRVRKLFNGNIEVNYYQYHGERPPRKADRAPSAAAPAEGGSEEVSA